jgi:drug/metabolite transporter (DMT)-like permease
MTATGNHMLRKMKSLHELTSAFYQNFFSLVVAFIYVKVVVPEDGLAGLAFTKDFSTLTWLVFGYTATSSLFGQILKVMAYQRAPASRLSPFGYFKVIYQTLYGIFVMGDSSNILTYSGISLVISLNVYKMVESCLCPKKKKQR